MLIIVLKLMVKKCLKKGKLLHLKIMREKQIDADFESILVPEDIEKGNLNESYTNKYQNRASCSYGYKLVCVDDKFRFCSQSFIRMAKDSNFCSRVTKKYFNKEIVRTKKNGKDFDSSTEC